MNANTVYDVFLALPEVEKQRHIQLVTEYNLRNDNQLKIAFNKKKNEVQFTKQDAIDYLLKNVFTSKKNNSLAS
ncbi:MAG: hypothetical protein RI980_896 [Bacteroidota bacterium]|jgi:hypothetical protein